MQATVLTFDPATRTGTIVADSGSTMPFGADAFSFGAGITLQEGDTMVVNFQGFGRPLRNPLAVDKAKDSLVRVTPL